MKEQIKHQLALLLEELEQWQGSFGEYAENESPLILAEAMGVGQFIKKCSLAIMDYELVGMAEAVYQKAKRLDDEETKRWDEYQESLRCP
jgi:hypothetical protein